MSNYDDLAARLDEALESVSKADGSAKWIQPGNEKEIASIEARGYRVLAFTKIEGNNHEDI